MVTSSDRGNEIYFNEQLRVWCYTNTTTVVEFKSKCPKCGVLHDSEFVDKCLGRLIGLMNACCGHGDIDKCYVQFLDGSMVVGEDARIIQDILIKYK